MAENQRRVWYLFCIANPLLANGVPLISLRWALTLADLAEKTSFLDIFTLSLFTYPAIEYNMRSNERHEVNLPPHLHDSSATDQEDWLAVRPTN